MAETVSQEAKNLNPFEELGFIPLQQTGDEWIGDCVFCGGRRKLYVNQKTQKFSCKSGKCGLFGNLTSFMEAWLEWFREWNEREEPDWAALSKDRGIPVATLKAANLVWDGERWRLPTYSIQGRVCNILSYKPGMVRGKPAKLIGLKYIERNLYGIESLAKQTSRGAVWLCEGEWDRLAMLILLRKGKRHEDVAVAVPGAGTFKADWAEALSGWDVIGAYDRDSDGVKGTERAYSRTTGQVKSFRYVQWPEALPEGYDVRDYYREDGSFRGINSLVADYVPESAFETTTDIASDYPLLREGGRPSIEEVLDVYGENLLMTEEMKTALRIIFAVVISNQIPGDPLWVHVCGPPGSSKTELIMSTREVPSVIARSTLTVHTLVSGYVKGSGKDSSLLPQLFGKTFVFKDWTEVLNMPMAQRYEIYSIFRGAYDGSVEKSFGTGITRSYSGYFNMITGVTPAVFRESGSAVGERFLIYHMMRENGGDNSGAVGAAFDSVGEELRIKSELYAAANSFLKFKIESGDLPRVPADIRTKTVALAQLVAMLRATVERDFKGESVLYRPSHELGTRLAKQFKKLLLGLGLQHEEPNVGADEFEIVKRVALDTCVGWNRDAVYSIIKGGGFTLQEIMEKADIPRSTLRDRLEDLVMLGVLKKTRKNEGKPGGPPSLYSASDVILAFWERAGIAEVITNPYQERPDHRRRRRKLRTPG